MRRWIIALGLGAAVACVGAFSSSSSNANDRVRPRVESVEPAPVRTARTPSLPVLPRRTKTGLPGLSADLLAADPKVRLAAVREVARSGDVDVAQLLAASRDPDPSVAAAAIAGLASSYADAQVPVADMIARANERTGGPRIHTMALNAVGSVPHPDTAKLLGQVATSSSVGERRAATALLGNQAPEDAIPLLIAALSDADEYVRDNAANGLRTLSRGRDFGTDAGAWQAWWQSHR